MARAKFQTCLLPNRYQQSIGSIKETISQMVADAPKELLDPSQWLQNKAGEVRKECGHIESLHEEIRAKKHVRGRARSKAAADEIETLMRTLHDLVHSLKKQAVYVHPDQVDNKKNM